MLRQQRTRQKMRVGVDAERRGESRFIANLDRERHTQRQREREDKKRSQCTTRTTLLGFLVAGITNAEGERRSMFRPLVQWRA